MTYKLKFKASAKQEFDKLDRTVKEQFKKKLKKILENPTIPKNKLHGSDYRNMYKIKLRAVGYRLVYEVIDDELVVVVIEVGRRDTIYLN